MRVRFAPSPTGDLHVGGARTALFNYLLAKSNGGSFIIRVEDTDENRSSKKFLDSQLSDLQWLGLKWDEGPDFMSDKHLGNKGPYFQSQRKDIYKKMANKLLEEGKAYYCFLTDKEIEEQKEKAMKEKRPYHVISPYRDWSLKKAQDHLKKNPNASVRFRISDFDKVYVIDDLIRGEVRFPVNMVGDFIILRSGGGPVYNFCCAVDDALMDISHVFRAEEHLSNTLRQLIIYEALGYNPPQFGHMSMILGEDKKKLSKRHGATGVNEYKKEGFFPETIINFISLLGWSHRNGKEILSQEVLEKDFDYKRMNAAPAVFDKEKLKWMNGVYLRSMNYKELWSRLEPFFEANDLQFPDSEQWKEKALELLKTSMLTLTDAITLFKPLSVKNFYLDEAAKDVLTWGSTSAVLKNWKNFLEKLPENEVVTEVQLSGLQNELKETLSVKGKALFMPFRVAAIGQAQGADVKSLLPLLSRNILLNRVSSILSSK